MMPEQRGGTRAPIGPAGWIALAAALIVGLIFTLLQASVVAVGIGALAARIDPPPTTTGPPPSDDTYLAYPGYEVGDSGLVLAQPPAEEVRATSAAALAAVETALSGPWTSTGDDYDERALNSYGGPSMLHDYVSAVAVQEVAIPDRQAAVDRFAAVLAPLGFDEVEVHDSPDEWYDAGYEVLDAPEAAGDALWLVRAWSSSDPVPTVELGIVDLGADPSGAVAEMLEDADVPTPRAGFFVSAYASGLLESSDTEAFVRAMEPFGGAEAPVEGADTIAAPRRDAATGAS